MMPTYSAATFDLFIGGERFAVRSLSCRCRIAWPQRQHGATAETLERRARYGGRKGARAQRRLEGGGFARPCPLDPLRYTAEFTCDWSRAKVRELVEGGG